MSDGAGIRFAPDPAGLLERVVDWAQTDGDVRALILLGSRARVDPPADEWSDTDLIVVVPDPSAFLADASWTARFGSVAVTFVEVTPHGRSERRSIRVRSPHPCRGARRPRRPRSGRSSRATAYRSRRRNAPRQCLPGIRRFPATSTSATTRCASAAAAPGSRDAPTRASRRCRPSLLIKNHGKDVICRVCRRRRRHRFHPGSVQCWSDPRSYRRVRRYVSSRGRFR